MAEDPGLSRSDWTNKIVRRTLGSLANWAEPQIRETIGPYLPAAFNAYTTVAGDLRYDLNEALSALSNEDFLASFDVRGAPKSDSAIRLVRPYSEQSRSWEEKAPRWFAGGFGHPEYVADFDYWSRMARLTLEEAVCLTIGVEPKHFPKNLLEDLRKLGKPVGPVLEFLLRRHELMRRKFDPFDRKSNVDPTQLVSWIGTEGIEVHPDFFAHFARRNTEKPVPSSDSDDVFTGDKPQLASVAKLISAIAIDTYGYVPGDARSPIPKELEDLAARLGLKLGRDTILTYLRIGAKDLPEGWNDK